MISGDNITLILQERKMRFIKIKKCAQFHTTHGVRSKDRNPEPV